MTDEENEIPFEGELQVSLFKDKEIRKVFHEDEWFFSVVDVIEALADPSNPRRYWSDLKKKLAEEGNDQLYEEIVQLKLPSSDGKNYATDTATTETVFRIIQSIPSPKAETFKRWLARVGYERIQEFQNPEIAIKRAILDYQLQGYDDDWIQARIRTRRNRGGQSRATGQTVYLARVTGIEPATFRFGDGCSAN